jgi:hypothetical protein
MRQSSVTTMTEYVPANRSVGPTFAAMRPLLYHQTEWVQESHAAETEGRSAQERS